MTERLYAAHELLAAAQARFDALANYEVTLRSTPAEGEPVEVRYCYRKPGFIRMDFIRPHAGAALAYSPQTHEVLLWPFGFHTFPRLTLSPDNRMIKGPNGHRVDQSDLGTLLGNVRELQQAGDAYTLGHDVIGSHRAAHLVITGMPGHVPAGVLRYQLWLDMAMGLPIKVVSDDERGDLIETVLMDDLRIDVADIKPFL